MASNPRATATPLAVAGLIAVLVAGCSSQPTASPTPASATASPTIATASPAPTPTPTPTPEPLPQGSEPVVLDPANFVATIDNPYWPLKPGSHWVYRETDAEGVVQTVDVTVTDTTKVILGITATVVHDTVTEDGELIEDTFDWYAQDRSGNVWYLGEDTKEYDAGEVVSTAGSWEAGVTNAQPGIVMPSQPQVGMAYRQEYLKGEAEDQAKILSLTEQADVPFGTFDKVVQTEETTPLEPDLKEHKYYAREVGLVLVVSISGGTQEELVSYTPGPTT